MWPSHNTPRSREALTDRATMDPPLTSAKTLWSGAQGQVDERIVMSLFGACLFREKPWQRPVVWPGPQAGPHRTNADL